LIIVGIGVIAIVKLVGTKRQHLSDRATGPL